MAVRGRRGHVADGRRSPRRLLLPHVHARVGSSSRDSSNARRRRYTRYYHINYNLRFFSMPISAWCSPSASSSNSSTMLVNAPSPTEGVTSRRETLEFRYARGVRHRRSHPLHVRVHVEFQLHAADHGVPESTHVHEEERVEFFADFVQERLHSSDRDTDESWTPTPVRNPLRRRTRASHVRRSRCPN